MLSVSIGLLPNMVGSGVFTAFASSAAYLALTRPLRKRADTVRPTRKVGTVCIKNDRSSSR